MDENRTSNSGPILTFLFTCYTPEVRQCDSVAVRQCRPKRGAEGPGPTWRAAGTQGCDTRESVTATVQHARHPLLRSRVLLHCCGHACCTVVTLDRQCVRQTTCSPFGDGIMGVDSPEQFTMTITPSPDGQCERKFDRVSDRRPPRHPLFPKEKAIPERLHTPQQWAACSHERRKTRNPACLPRGAAAPSPTIRTS